MPEGTVRWFDADRGFGFIALGDEAEDLFVHVSEVVGDDATTLLREGQVVEFEIGEGDRGPQARRVRVTGDQAVGAALGVLGTVAWYEPAKGYGFVTPDGGGPQIFVHSSAIVTGGVVSEGQRVAYLVVPGEKGPQADHLLPLGAQAAGAGGSAPRRAAAASAPRGRSGHREASRVPARGGEGVVARYDADRGFGFIAPDAGGADLFVHVSVVRGAEALHEGDRVRFQVRQSDRGPQADRVERV